MVEEFVYSPHVDFFIDKIDRTQGYDMKCFHVHHKFEIYYEVTGTRRYYIEDMAYIVNAGNVVLIGANQIHKTGSVGNTPSTRYVINFSDEYLYDITKNYSETDITEFLSEPENHLLTGLSNKEQMQVEQMLEEMERLYKIGSPEAAFRCKIVLLHLLFFLKEMCQKQKSEAFVNRSKNSTNKLVTEVQSYVSQNYMQDLTLNGIAANFYISPYYLSRLFKRTMNIGIVEYIKSVRTKAAQNLLETTDESVQTVAEKAGFGTTAHFRRVFKDTTGLSPQKYRQYYRKNK